MSCTPLPKAAKPVWAKQLTRLPCLVGYAKFHFVYTSNLFPKKATVHIPNLPRFWHPQFFRAFQASVLMKHKFHTPGSISQPSPKSVECFENLIEIPQSPHEALLARVSDVAARLAQVLQEHSVLQA